MSLIGLDLNATRARAIQGPRPQAGVPLPLEGEHLELPLALSLEGRQPVVGRAGTTLCRRLPHLACLDFLPQLGRPRKWTVGRHSLDAGQALGLVFENLLRPLGKAPNVFLALPPYLREAQRNLVTRVVDKARWRLLGSVATPVAAALAAQGQLPWAGLALVGDVDGHALTWSAVDLGGDEAVLVRTHAVPGLGLGAWMGRLIDGAAHRCVRLSRRDPRESAEAEQSLHDQLLASLDHTGPIDLVLQTAHWYQRLPLQPADLAAFCAPLARQMATEMEAFLSAVAASGPVGAVLLTAPAARLPGLVRAIEAALDAAGLEGSEATESDFGEGLLQERMTAGRVHVLGPDDVARAAHDLACRVHAGGLPSGYLDAVPLTAAGSADPGPARLHFRGRDHFLSSAVFTLGRDPSCDLVFESELYPSVSGRHCEVVLDRRVYTLRDRSRHGTLVNDRPVSQQVALRSGDWIQLGPEGPLLRFLGQPPSRPQLLTMA